jgi:CDP-glycerol glycerophosphotransferase
VYAVRTPARAAISVVIPVFDVREYLADCLDSVLGQPTEPGIEVIAVDDASQDGSGALLDERAKNDPRMTVVHLTRTVGPGNARNVGLARATGAYVWFVDGDDLVAPGALAAIRACLAESEPDVLLIDYEDLFPDGMRGPSPGGPILRSASGKRVSLAEAPTLIDLTMTAWSKVFRRDFLVGLAEPFRGGIHEDIPVSCAALLRGRISTLDVVCYRYRRSRPGSFMATTSTSHMAVFDAYAEVFDMLTKLEETGDPVATPAVRTALFERAMTHYTAVLGTAALAAGHAGRSWLVPREDLARFFDRMTADFVRYVPDGYRIPRSFKGVKFWLIKRGRYRAYELLAPVNRVRVAMRGKQRTRDHGTPVGVP